MTQSERLVRIEEIASRTEGKLDEHITQTRTSIANVEQRVSKLEKAWAWLSGVVAVVGVGLGAWLKGMFGRSQ